jgi:glyoxylase-like metal-dependent hydrolase (beta-lactamase superfamily II)
MTVRATGLTWDVYVAPAEPAVTDDLSAGETQRQWSPASATLISGKREPCSSTPLLTTGPARGLADWVAAHGRNLTAVYITHGHGDHRFGLSIILDRFPGARAFALPAVIEQMRQGSGHDLPKGERLEQAVEVSRLSSTA